MAEATRNASNNEDQQSREARLTKASETSRNNRNPIDEEVSQQCHEQDRIHKRDNRIPGQLARGVETPQEAQSRIQMEFEKRSTNRRANKKGCQASLILKGDINVKIFIFESPRFINLYYFRG